ncbi:protein NATD1-like [Myripristis murdjan]|uniref:Protein NATD1 n=1 Tax=Myripristis murdjan TaxID=586833 RepID=A0A667Z2V1_9TELE|nr:protein NATD1-like [Myripristis murdjan]
MAFKLVPSLTALKSIRQFRCFPGAFSAVTSSGGVTVRHDRENRRFTVSLGSGAGLGECAVLRYRFTGEKEVDLMSTNVPESFRGRGVAAVLSKAAMDFLVDENLKARVSCWYIKKYIEENPQLGYKDLVIT